MVHGGEMLKAAGECGWLGAIVKRLRRYRKYDVTGREIGFLMGGG